jgi:hypothetical protein
MNGLGIPVLRALDEERNNGRARINDQLPGVGIMEIGAGDRPDQDKHAASNERRRSPLARKFFVQNREKALSCRFHLRTVLSRIRSSLSHRRQGANSANLSGLVRIEAVRLLV